MIYHITAAVAWEAAKLLGAYEGDSLASEGFIHCSTAGQVAGVANGLFRGAEGLVVLHIEVARLASPVKYENLEGGKELFPHVYGPITVDAVEMVTPLRAGPDGEFEFA